MCLMHYKRVRRIENHEKVRASEIAYEKKNRERLNANVRAYYARNAELVKALAKDYKMRNADKVKAYMSQWRARNEEHLRRYRRSYRERNIEAVRVRVAQRRAMRRDAEGRYTLDEILELRKKQKGRCAACFKAFWMSYHIDHVMPLSKGGGNGITNIQLLCPPCNLSKGAKDPIDWANQRGLLL